MKIRSTVWIVCCLFLSQKANAQNLFDNFNGNSVNTNLWQIYTPFSDSTATEGSGVLTIQNHGGLISKVGFSGPIEIDGRFAFTGNAHDLFTFIFGTSGQSGFDSLFTDGIRLSWLKEGDPGEIENIVSLSQITDGNPSHDIELALGHFDFSYNQFYDFKITDDGSNIAVYFGDLVTPLLTATDSTVAGDKIGFYNREGAGNGSSISAGSEVKIDYITAVPEPTAFSLFSLGVIMFTCRYRGQTRTNAKF